jgi:hypothetical protein
VIDLLVQAGLSEQSAVAITVAIIGACALLTAAVIALIGVVISQRRDVKVIRHQVTNDHDTNLRIEGDERHAENSDRFRKIEASQASLVRSVTRIEDHLGIEHTTPRPRRRTR